MRFFIVVMLYGILMGLNGFYGFDTENPTKMATYWIGNIIIIIFDHAIRKVEKNAG